MDSPIRQHQQEEILSTPNQPIRRKQICTDIIDERKKKRPRETIHIPLYANENINRANFTELFPQVRPVNIQNLFNLSYTGTLFDQAIENEVPKEMNFSEEGCSLCLENHDKGYIYCTRKNCEHVVHEECMMKWRSHCIRENISFSCPFCRCKELKL